ncbi:MAG: PQQ-binding-like beta-propeller repeat protein [bacterium]
MKPVNHFLVMLGMIVLFCAPVGAGDDVPSAESAWTATFDKDIVWQQLTDAGYLVVCTNEALFGLDPTNGQIAWKLDDVKKLPEDYFEVLSGTQFAVVNKKSGPLGVGTETILLDVIEGKVLWTSKEIGLGSTSGQFFLPPAGGMLIYGNQAKTQKPTFLLANLLTGTPIWTNETIFKKPPLLLPLRLQKKTSRLAINGNQPPLHLADGSFLEFWSSAGLRKINAKTGEVIWTTKFKFKEIPAVQSGYAPMLLSDDGKVVYVPHEKTIGAFNTADGSALWVKLPKLVSGVTQMVMTPGGLVVKGVLGKKPKSFITVLNPATGEAVWKKPFRDLKSASSFAIKDDKIAIWVDEEILLINIADASVTEVAKKVKFSGGEAPNGLELRNNGYLLLSDQNMTLYAWNGNPVYHAFHKAPGTSLLSKVASTAAIMAVNAMSAVSAYSKAYETGMDQKYDLITNNPTMSKRFKATAAGNNYVSVLCQVEGGSDSGPGLIKVDKATGADVKCVVLGTKKPEYVLDDFENRLFFMKDDKTIECFNF